MRKHFSIHWFAAAMTIVLLASCSGGPDRVDLPDYAADAGATAVSQYDANKDGTIAGDELDAVPALKISLEQVDANADGRLTAQEIDARIQSWRDTRTGEMMLACQVTLDGAPLPGAKVEFEPEPFLGSAVKPALATTGADGEGSISMADEYLADPRYPGVACGWYKIRVTSSAQDIPARYNTATTLGCEVAQNAHWSHRGAVELKLQSD